MAGWEKTLGRVSLRRLALGLALALVMAIGLCPVAFADEVVEVEPRATEETTFVTQGDDAETELRTQYLPPIDYLDANGATQTCTN